MSRLALAVLVLVTLGIEVRLSVGLASAPPVQRVAARALEPSELVHPAQLDPLAMVTEAPRTKGDRLAWSADNPTLEEILDSAIWRASAECTDGAVSCNGLHGTNALRPL